MKKIIAIYGVTTSNKLGVALNLAKYIWGKYKIVSEVVNVDSRKIYKDFKVSQSLPTKSLLQKVKAHLFGIVSAKEKWDLFSFQNLAKEKIADILKRGSLPILVGGSALHILCILQDWKNGEKRKRKKISVNTLVIGVTIEKKLLKAAVRKNVDQMFRKGLYEEFKRLYAKAQKGKMSKDLLEETLGYRQFLEMARVSKKSPLKLNQKDLAKIKKWIIKDILDYAYHQSLDYKRFAGINLIRDFQQARKAVDLFLCEQSEISGSG